MSDALKPDSLAVTLTVEQLRDLIREEFSRIAGGHVRGPDDRLLTADETAKILNVRKEWLYRHKKQLPFTRSLSRKNIKFSEAGLRKWMIAKKL